MNYVKYFVLFILSAVAMADCSTSLEEAVGQEVITTDVPSHLQGATITVRRADGKESTVSAEQFKVVPRKQQFIVTRVRQKETCSERIVNRISLIGGAGPTNRLSVVSTPGQATISTGTGAVGGLQYQRSLGTISVGAQVQTNDSAALLLGLDF